MNMMVPLPTSPSRRSATGPSLSPLKGGEGLLLRVRMLVALSRLRAGRRRAEDWEMLFEAYPDGSSLGLLEVDQDRVGGQESNHDRQEINDVAQIDDASRNGAEMPEKARLRDAMEQPFRRPALKNAEDNRRARYCKNEGERGRDHKRDDLVLGHRRNAGADSEKGSRHQPAADVAGEDDTVVRAAEKIDGDPERKGQNQGNPGEAPCRKEFSGHGLGHADRQCQKQLDRPDAALLGPQPQRQGRDQHDVEPGMKGKEGLEIGLAPLEEIAYEERQYSRHHEKNDDEHIGEWRREVGGQLAAEDGQDVAHRGQAAAAIAAGSGRAPVISRKTSSSRPRSTCRPVMLQPRSRARFAISLTTGCPPRGYTISPSPAAPTPGSTAATPGSAASSALTFASAPPAMPRRTAL